MRLVIFFCVFPPQELCQVLGALYIFLLEKAEWYVKVLVSVGPVAAVAAGTVPVVVAAGTVPVVVAAAAVAAAVAVLSLLLLLLTPFSFLDLLYMIFLCAKQARTQGEACRASALPKISQIKIIFSPTFCI